MDSLTYIRKRLGATYRQLLLTELSHIEMACDVKTIKQLSKGESVDLINMIETVKRPDWTIANRHADTLILKIKRYSKKK